MKISELVQVLEDLQEQHGDVDVVLIDADTEWSWLLNETNVYFSNGDKGTGAAVVIKEHYGDAVDYDWPASSSVDIKSGVDDQWTGEELAAMDKKVAENPDRPLFEFNKINWPIDVKIIYGENVFVNHEPGKEAMLYGPKLLKAEPHGK